MHPLIPYFETLKIPISGDFAIHGFGILVALGFVFGSQQAIRKAARDGLDPDMVNRQVSWMVAAVFIGGHLGHLLFYYPEQILEDPMSLLRVWQGLSSFGGFIGCAVLGVWFYKREDKRIRRENKKALQSGGAIKARPHIWGYADAGLFGLMLGWALGRMGCFVAHDHPGTETNFFLGVKGMLNPNNMDYAEKVSWIERAKEFVPGVADADPSAIPSFLWQQVAYHDMGLYEAIWSICMFGLFLVLDRKPRPPGFFVGMVFAIYGPLRLVMDIFRHASTDTRYFGFTPAQFFAAAMGMLGVWILWSKRNDTPVKHAMAEFRERHPEAPEAADASE
jgi:phosphatidylglycerol---prolipoprotein diacylglyceryl transferase